MKKYLVMALSLALGAELSTTYGQQQDKPTDKPAAESRDRNADAVKNLAGAYTVISAEKNGQPTPKEELGMVSVRFTKDTIVATDKDKKEVYAATYQLDTSEKPATITMKSTLEASKDVTVKGLIEIEGDQVRLVYNLPSDVGAQPGTEAGKRQIMVVMKKDKEPRE